MRTEGLANRRLAKSSANTRALSRVISTLLLGAVTACSAATSAPIARTAPSFTPTPRQAALLDTVGERTFRWFWDVTDARTGLTPDPVSYTHLTLPTNREV